MTENQGRQQEDKPQTAGRILLVEDNPMNVLVAQTFLERCGAHIDVATNGREALDKFNNKKHRLVLMDLDMPEMDGYEFRWEGLSRGTERGDVHLWGRVIFVPTGNEGDTTGATLILFTTSLAPELSSVEDVGTEGEARVILDTFSFGRKQ